VHNILAAKNLIEKYYTEDVGEDGRIILKCILKKYDVILRSE
jgi:hypothetical protein